MKRLVAFGSGLIFALGLGISGMTNPANVLAFLDLRGAWNPALMLVMVAAIGVNATFVWIASRRRAPVLDTQFHLPSQSRIDARLISGAAVFGAGWGLSGYCPGPALVSMAAPVSGSLLFVAGLLVGVIAYRIAEETQVRPTLRTAGSSN